MSSALTVYPHLPPTTNSLNSQQRVRLIRSTRKLGAVLGTTPYLLETDTSFSILPLGKTNSRELKRQGSFFTHHQHSSLSVISSPPTAVSHHPSASKSASPISLQQSADSLPTNPPGLSITRRHRAGDKIQKLYLQLNAVPVSSTEDPATSLLPPTPCTPTPPVPLTPPVPDIAEIRRKRMAKLARHLGENIPAELLFTSQSAPVPPVTSTNRNTLRRTRSASVRPQVALTTSNPPPLGRSKQDWVGEWNRSNINVVQKELRNLKAR